MSVNKDQMKKQIRQGRGIEKADHVLKNCVVVDVFCGETVKADVAICDEIIVGVGKYKGKIETDCQGAYVCPGFMEGHIHIESSMLSPSEFAKTVLPHGTTTVICDPHEIANVAGIEGINYFLEESRNACCSIFMMAPSCVPATHLETSGAVLSALDLQEILQFQGVLGIAEMMNFPGVLFEDDGVLEKMILAQKKKVIVDGHAPGLTGKDLQAYVGTGILSDHECTTVAEAHEKLAAGMYLFIREGSTAKNLKSLIPVLNARNSHRCLLVTDDCHPGELSQNGHLDRILRKAILLGVDPITAIQMVTINVSNYFGLQDRGAIAPGRLADLVVVEDLKEIRVGKVFVRGREIKNTASLVPKSNSDIRGAYPSVFDSVHVNIKNLSFTIAAKGTIARVIKIVPDQLITESVEFPMLINNEQAVSDIDRDILKIAVIERHMASGNCGLGFVQGLGLKKGAIASTISHDSHNIVIIGCNDQDMKTAVQVLVEQGGGLAVVCDGNVEGSLSLEIAGLMSSASALEVAETFSNVLKGVAKLGIDIEDPFMLMSFLALPVIPHLKITDIGLVNVDTFSTTELWVDAKTTR